MSFFNAEGVILSNKKNKNFNFRYKKAVQSCFLSHVYSNYDASDIGYS